MVSGTASPTVDECQTGLPKGLNPAAFSATVAALVFSLGQSALAEQLTELDGLLEPDMTVDLASPVPGVVEAIDVDRSDFVSKDQVLVKLQDGIQQAQVELANVRANLSGEIKAKQAALELAKRRHERMSQLYEKKVIPLDDKDEAEAKARVAQQELNASSEKKKIASFELALAEEELNLRVIKSPIDGVIMERFVQPGGRVAEEPILRIARIDPLRVEVVVPVDYFDAVKPGMQARVIPELPIDDNFVATVTRVDRVVDAASGTFTARLTLPNPGRKLPSGLKCKVVFDQGLTKVYTRKQDTELAQPQIHDAIGTSSPIEDMTPRPAEMTEPAKAHTNAPVQAPVQRDEKELAQKTTKNSGQPDAQPQRPKQIQTQKQAKAVTSASTKKRTAPKEAEWNSLVETLSVKLRRFQTQVLKDGITHTLAETLGLAETKPKKPGLQQAKLKQQALAHTDLK